MAEGEHSWIKCVLGKLTRAREEPLERAKDTTKDTDDSSGEPGGGTIHRNQPTTSRMTAVGEGMG